MFNKGDRVRAKTDKWTKSPVGTVVGSIIGDGLEVYLVWMEDVKKNSVEFVDPLNPHLERV